MNVLYLTSSKENIFCCVLGCMLILLPSSIDYFFRLFGRVCVPSILLLELVNYEEYNAVKDAELIV